jgi:hypothetical protein
MQGLCNVEGAVILLTHKVGQTVGGAIPPDGRDEATIPDVEVELASRLPLIRLKVETGKM